MAEALIQLSHLQRTFPAGEGTIAVLKDINLTINAGEMVAIVGQSGSGKSTLMNILGCLDRPSSGSYKINGRETTTLANDEFPALRREHFGFIFQRYHLLAELNALGNVEIPAIYANKPAQARHDRAKALLTRLGMAERVDHLPGQLSGGQQQRVSIARALMNEASVILADEPTGALDSHSGEEVLRILNELHAEGKTIILVTHDMSIAEKAQRVIEIRDGEIIADTRKEPLATQEKSSPIAPNIAQSMGADVNSKEASNYQQGRSWAPLYMRFKEAFHMALLSMKAHQLRTFLTMLGIIIGIASVVCVVALGEGSRQQVLANISSLGTNTLEIFPGKNLGDSRSGKITTLVISDANELAKLPYLTAVTPTVSTNLTLRYNAIEANAQVNGVGDQYFTAKGSKLAMGNFFDAESIKDLAQVVVIDENTAKTFFGDSNTSPIGKVIFVGRVPARIIGVMQAQQGGFGSSQSLAIYMPYTTVQARFLGSKSLRSITVRVNDDTTTSAAEQAVTKFLTDRHGVKDFIVLNTDDIRQTITSTTETMTLLISSIAIISLLVGGIGVMNIMLVSVSERIGEIGVRMAVGARQSDILQQFLIEAVLVCLIGGTLGILLALGFGVIFSMIGSSFSLVYSTSSIVMAFLCSSLIGIVFGYLPARNASQLDPVVALSRN
jgi:macrolide transport system ATP-binding/permease protein